MRSDYISREEFTELVGRLPYEYRPIVVLAAETGYRIDDLCNAPYDAYNRDERTLTLVERKTGKERVVDLSPAAVAALNDVERVRGFIRHWLIEYDTDKPCNRVTVWRWIRRTWRLMRMGDDRVISPHSLRKLYAVERRTRGWTVEDIQMDLNHDNMSTTLIYAFADVMAAARCKIA